MSKNELNQIEERRDNFLGIHVNEHLSWKPHITHISNLITRTIGVLNRLKNSPTYIYKTHDIQLHSVLSRINLHSSNRIGGGKYFQIQLIFGFSLIKA